ncbi:MAG TPA: RHS repeat-associated core domain-containing protein, partial [Allosphingosinicella sp.]|nr:RHS repeat-associated core domain-containing protein [Allosphingosinicella sp.]
IGKYDEYGAGGTSRFRYTGQYWLGEANLLYYRARIYDARLGRFLQPDPIGYGGGMNMYAYVGGDPMNFTDPTGLACASWRSGGSVTEEGGTVTIVRGRYEEACWDAGGGWGPTRYYNESGDGGGSGETPDPRKAACEAALEAAGQDNSAIARAEAAWPLLSKAAQNLIATRLLAAVGVRESGFRNVSEVGGGGGRGVFQITGNGVSDANAYNVEWAARWAAQKLSSDFNYFRLKFPSFTNVQLAQATAASYNFYRTNVRGDPSKIDQGTTRDNYGSNVLQIGGTCFSKR